MARRLRPGLFSLQTRLVIAMTSLILLGVVATGVVFVLRDREESERREIQSIAASAPSIFQRAAPFDVLVTNPDESTNGGFGSRLDRIASERDLRILLVDQAGTVLHDSADSLQGTIVSYPASDPSDLQRGYVAWAPGSPAPNFTFVASAGEPLDGSAGEPMPFIPIGTDLAPPPFGMVLGVETAKIENAWINALPGVGIAAAIVTPFAVILAVLLSRQIARPVHQLTAASEAMAGGNFDQRVEVGDREDEVGRLAKAFSTMAERVGERDAQMRALIANVSHDLKTPMTSIIGYAQALRDGVATDTQRAAETIQQQANLAHDLLSDLLFLSEIDSGQSVRVARLTPVSEIVDAAILRMRPVAEANGVEFDEQIDEDATVMVDAEGILRALSNVLGNAVRFSNPGNPVLIKVAQGDGEVVLSVENMGPRIDEADLPFVFDRFYRGRDQSGGHGLGLAIAREAVEMNAGHVEIANLAGGVRASIYLPA